MGTVSAMAETRLTFDAAVDVGVPLGTQITNTAEAAWQGNPVAATASFNTRPQVFMPFTYRDYCPPDYLSTFDYADSHWPAGEDEAMAAQFLGGEYRLLSKQPFLFVIRSPMCAQSNYAVQTDMRWNGMPGSVLGVIVGLRRDFSEYYLIVLNTEHQVLAAYRRNPSGEFTVVGQPLLCPEIRTGTGTNTVVVTLRPPWISVAVNYRWSGSWPDYDGIRGPTYAGLAMAPYDELPMADARFDNFRVTSRPGIEGVAALQLGAAGTSGSLSVPWRLPSPERVFAWGPMP
jgi:hypothetical protein